MSKELLDVKYNAFKQQTTDAKLDTLFVKIEDLRIGQKEACLLRHEDCEKQFTEIKKSRKFDKLYAGVGGAVGAVAIMLGKLGHYLIWGDP